MNRLFFPIAIAGFLLAQSTSQQPQVFRATSDVVPLFVTVSDKGHLVTDLTREDFQVFDNGKPQQITLFDKSPQPIRLVVMVDVSGSMVGNLALMRGACEELVRHLTPGDLAKVGSF